MAVQIGLIPGMLREETQKDLFGTLEKVAEIGYKGLEFGRFKTHTADQLKKKLDSLKLTPICHHTMYEQLEKDFDSVVNYTLASGCRYLVLNWHTYDSLEDVRKSAAFYNDVGERCAKKGIQFCYHNHAHEFLKYGDERAFDIIMENTDPEFLKIQFDTFWFAIAGLKIGDDMVKYKGRFPLIHFQDKIPDDPGIIIEKQPDGYPDHSPLLTEIGTGVVDFAAIAALGEKGGAQWYSVEQWIPGTKYPPMESIRISFENLRRLGVA